jgi:hypothetical protein
MADFLSTQFNGAKLSEALDRFGAKVKGAVLLSGAAAMGNVMYEEVKLQAPALKEAHWFYGTHQKYLLQPGALKKAIRRLHYTEKSSAERQVYKVTWNHALAPHGFMVQYGTSRAAANPFMTRAFAKVQQAISAGQARMAQKMAEGLDR